ncbi:MAG: hypothetical protein NTX56_14340 [Proteobacteria bacterium]|nr:hypothetical protein [Pseudomonadota bacterium]
MGPRVGDANVLGLRIIEKRQALAPDLHGQLVVDVVAAVDPFEIDPTLPGTARHHLAGGGKLRTENGRALQAQLGVGLEQPATVFVDGALRVVGHEHRRDIAVKVLLRVTLEHLAQPHREKAGAGKFDAGLRPCVGRAQQSTGCAQCIRRKRYAGEFVEKT